MLFNSLHFLFFLPVVVTLYYLLSFKYRWILIFIASCYFYMALIPSYILVLFFLIGVDYIAAIKIEQLEGKSRKAILIVSLIANIGLLAFFKYFNFFNEQVTLALSFMHIANPVSNLSILLPIGLSFHTFQSMAYTIEVYRGNQKAERHLGYFANYVLFFPQMVAGPIERYSRLGNQLKACHNFSYENFSAGFRLILFGMFTKIAIADNLAPVVNSIYENPQNYNSLSIFIAIIFFSFQIYADFYGYSLIAMGAAKLMGINLMENFKTPYLAKNINEFWKRWHISLTSWFRDYLYIPLGGRRVKFPRWIFNVLLVFVLSGLWHGASWTFIIWGTLHGLGYLTENILNKILKINTESRNILFNTLRILKTFLFVSFAWVFFRAESFIKAKLIFKALLRNTANTFETFTVDYKIWALLLLFILFDTLPFNYRIDNWMGKKPIYLRWSIYAVLIFAVMALGGIENTPFIYFQF
jgi:alginate O-acetyltransferase complex protein AlgI